MKVCRRTRGSRFVAVYENLAFRGLQLREFCIRTCCSPTRSNWLKSLKFMTIDIVVCSLTGLWGIWKRTRILAGKSSLVMKCIFGWMATQISNIAAYVMTPTYTSFSRWQCNHMVLGWWCHWSITFGKWHWWGHNHQWRESLIKGNQFLVA